MYSTGSPNFKNCSIGLTKVKQRDYIRIQLSSQLKRKSFTIGRDDKDNSSKAIEAAIAIDRYCNEQIAIDAPIDLARIKQIVTEIKKPYLQIVNSPKIKLIWEDYVNFHKSLGCWGQSYILTHIKVITNLVSRKDFPTDIDRPSEVLQWFLDGKRSVRTARDRFKLIVAAVDWASKNDRLDRQLGLKWRDCLSSLNGKLKSDRKTNKEDKSDSDEDKIDPFSIEEVESILNAFKSETFSRYKGRHYQYYHYLKFLWLTGCRPSEAIALKWDNIDLNGHKLKFCEGYVMSSGTLVKKKGTKTVPSRWFPINSDLEMLLVTIPINSDYVFTNYLGEPISQHALNRVWQGILKKLGIRYRIPYNLRHSMISYHANRGFPIVQLANIVGNSEDVIRKHYLKIDISLINVPTIE